MIIESSNNNKFLLWKKLKQKKYRDLNKLFLVYGNHLVEEALKANLLVTTISSNESIAADFYISSKMFKELCDLPSIPDIMGVVQYKNAITKLGNKVLILDDIQDPDNLGALLRSALAFGFNDIILSNRSVSIYNEKAIRASQGALFHLNIIKGDLVKKISELKMSKYLIVGADNKNTSKIIPNKSIALVLGNEGSGISDEVNSLIDVFTTIKTKKVESLNVSVAGAILMYEWSK